MGCERIRVKKDQYARGVWALPLSVKGVKGLVKEPSLAKGGKGVSRKKQE